MNPITPGPAPGWKAEAGHSLRLAGPLALANLLQMLTYAIDVMFIARLGAQELAASALAAAIFGLLIWSLQSLTGAVAPIMAAELGARAPALRPVRRAMRMALWLSIATGAVAMAICAAGEQIMLATGQDRAVARLAGDYMAILLWSTIPMIAAGVLRNFVAALGRPVFATLITAVGIAVNVLANWVLIFGNWGAPALGLEGAAIATLLTSLVTLALYVIAIAADPRLARYHVFGFFWRPDWPRLSELVRLGFPIGLTVLAEAGVFGAAAFLMGRIGALELAAHTIALQIAALAFQVPFGVSQAATIRVGYFFGASDPEGIKRAGWTAIALGSGFMLLTATLIVLAPDWLLWVYLDTRDPANEALAVVALGLLAVAAAFQVFDGLQVVAAGALRGLKDTRMPMWIALFSYWGPGFGLAAWLGLATSLGAIGVWIGLAAGLVTASVLLMWRWHRRGVLGLVPMMAKRSAIVMNSG